MLRIDLHRDIRRYLRLVCSILKVRRGIYFCRIIITITTTYHTLPALSIQAMFAFDTLTIIRHLLKIYRIRENDLSFFLQNNSNNNDYVSYVACTFDLEYVCVRYFNNYKTSLENIQRKKLIYIRTDFKIRLSDRDIVRLIYSILTERFDIYFCRLSHRETRFLRLIYSILKVRRGICFCRMVVTTMVTCHTLTTLAITCHRRHRAWAPRESP